MKRPSRPSRPTSQRRPDTTPKKESKEKEPPSAFAELYPNIAWFVESWGYVTLGRDEDSFDPVYVRALDEGGTVWEGKYSYESVDAALQDLEKGLAKWMKEEKLEE